MRLYSLTLVLWAVAAPLSFADSKDVQILQDAARRVIAENEPSVASILVSRSERYREFGASISSVPGKLGTFHPPPFRDEIQRAAIRRLDLASPSPVPESYGSGVVIDRSGLILTHYHVVRDATKVYVRLPGKKESYADIIGAESRSDFAVLKMIDPPADLKPIRIGDGGKVSKGDFVVGIANPFSTGFRASGPTSSHGIIANVRTKVKTSFGNEVERSRSLHLLRTYIQTDLRLNLGCSGGGVFNLEGELIALTTSTAAVVGGETPAGFAVPLDANMKRIIDVLKKGEEVEYGFLGVSFSTQDGADRGGVIIDRVAEGTPAMRAGLQRNEKITAVNDILVGDNESLSQNIGTALAGSEVTLDLQSFGGRVRKVKVKLAKFKESGPSIVSNPRPPVFGLHVDYSSVAQSNLPVPEGVFIREVDRGSAAEKKYGDLLDRPRWIITRVNGKAVTTPAEFYRETNNAKHPVEFQIVDVSRNPEASARTITLP